MAPSAIELARRRKLLGVTWADLSHESGLSYYRLYRMDLRPEERERVGRLLDQRERELLEKLTAHSADWTS